MPVRQSRGHRLLTITLYLGCAGAVAFIARPLVSGESVPGVIVKKINCPPVDLDLSPLPPGTWTLLSAEHLHALSRDAEGPTPPPASSPLLPPTVTPAAVRVDESGRVSAFLTGSEELNTFTRHWTAGGWVVTEPESRSGGTRTLALSRGPERAVAWVFPAVPSDRVHLLVTVTRPRTEDRP